MITTGLILAGLTATGFFFLYRKLPRRIKKFLRKHILLTDTVACLLTYMLFGGTLVALFAAAWMCVLVSILLILVNNPSTNALLERLADKCTEVGSNTLKWVEDYIKKQEKKTPNLKSVSDNSC